MKILGTSKIPITGICGNLQGGQRAKGITTVNTNLGSPCAPKKGSLSRMGILADGAKKKKKILLGRALNMDIWSQLLIVWTMRTVAQRS